jgi:electron transport complex protein RnfB
MLPGVNCGGCGYAGCADFAKALALGQALDVSLCTVASPESRKEIASYLGIDSAEKLKKVAVILCGGDRKLAKPAALYNGVCDCNSAVLVVAGAKGCQFGCLGYGSCAKACPFGAIEITENSLALVHPELCTGCGKCVKTCPKKLIKLVPTEVKVHILCSSPMKAVVKKKYCDVSCIACRKCVKAASEGQMIVNGFLVQTNYDNPPSVDVIEKAGCPTGCLKTNPPLKNAKSGKEAA